MAAHERPPSRWPEKQGWLPALTFTMAVGVLLYLCWRILAPFVPAIAWAFALAVIAEPIQSRLVRPLRSRSMASFITVLLIIVVIIVPSFFLLRSLFFEVADLVQLANKNQTNIRETIERIAVLGPVLRWVDEQVNLPDLLRA